MRATAGVELPEEGHYAAGIAFLDRDIATSGQQEQAISKIVREEGLEVLAWRVVPTNPDGLGLQALASMPAFKTLVVADPEGKLGGIELDRKTFRIRKRVEHEVGIYFASLSARTITYKGMLTTMQLKPFFLDLSDERMKAKNRHRAFPLLHQHVPKLAAGTAVPPAGAQRRDQHHPRQPQLAVRT